MHIAKALLAVLTLVGLLALSFDARAESPNDILIVANKKVSIDSVSPAELKAIFLKRRTSWRDGGKAVPVHAKEGTSLRKLFQRKVLGMHPSEEQSYWQEQKIRKGLTPPAEFSSTLKAVFSVKGAVSYVYRKQYKEGVAKVLMVVPAN